MRYASTMASTQAQGAPASYPDTIVVDLCGQPNAPATGFVTTAARLPVLIAVALAAACQHGNPTRTELSPPAVAGVAGVASGTLAFVDSVDARQVIDNVVERIGPSLADSTAGRLIVTVFRKLQQSIDDRDVSTRIALISSARAIVDAYATFGNDDTEQVDAIRLALTALANSV